MLQRVRRFNVVVLVGGLLVAGLSAQAQDGSQRRGRKYKAPPATSHIEVLVTKASNGKPISNAAVIFRATRDGKDDGNLEVKTDPDGKAALDVIQTGSNVLVQVFANGYATFADSYQVDEASREIHVGLERPREQVSAYVDNSGKASTRKAGVQEPEPQKPAPSATTLQPRPGSGSGGTSGQAGSNGKAGSSGSQTPSTTPPPAQQQTAPPPAQQQQTPPAQQQAPPQP